MKQSFIFSLLLCLTACAFDKSGKEEMPAFNLLLADSSTLFNTGQIPAGEPVVFMFFDPDCEHCQKETEDLLHNMNALQNVRFYFFTVEPFDRLKVFYHHYKLGDYPNIILGRDYSFFFPKYFGVRETPCLAIYNKNKQLNAVFVGGADVHKIIKIIEKLM